MEQEQKLQDMNTGDSSEEVVSNSTNDQDQKLIPQDQLNRIVARVKDKAAEEAAQKYEAKMQELRQSQEQRNEHVSREEDADTIYQKVYEKFNKDLQRKQLESEMLNVANNYYSKINLAKDSYDDFEDVTKNFDPTEFPQVVHLLAGVDNAGDVVYELSKNPSKLVTIDGLAKSSPNFARNELIKLSTSISANKQAKEEAEQSDVNAPLDTLRSSRNLGSSDMNSLSIQDFKNMDWLNG